MVPDSDRRQPSNLEELAQAQFGPLSDAERKLLRAAPKGETAYCGLGARDDDPNNNPADSDNWDSERWVSAELVRWLCVDRVAKDRVDPRGIRVHCAGIRGKLDLSFVVVPFFLGLFRCSFSDDLDLRFVEIPAIHLSGSCFPSMNADYATVRGGVWLRGVCSSGKVQLRGARIGGNLACDGSKFQNPAAASVAEGGEALNAESTVVGGAVLLRNGFAAEGQVRMFGIQIGRNLECDDGKFLNPAKASCPGGGMALNVEGAKVAGGVFLRGRFIAEGQVKLLGTEIGGSLDCNGGKFQNAAKAGVPESGLALDARGAKVDGGVFLSRGFAAQGGVLMNGTTIGVTLQCDGGKFQNPALPGIAGTGLALIAEGAKVGGSVLLRNGFTAEGGIWLLGAQIQGSLSCEGGTLQNPAAEKVDRSGVALSADGAKVGGPVLLRWGFAAQGQVRLMSTQIGVNLECDSGTFQNPGVANAAESGMALLADGAKVAGAILLRHGFRADGQVRLYGAEIGGGLSCDGGTFQNPSKANVARSGVALSAENAKVIENVNLRRGFVANGEVRLYGAEIRGYLGCQEGTFESLDLRSASAGGIQDDEKSWPKPGSLLLDGFVYDRIAGGPVAAGERLRWLARQPAFTRHPYRQLAKVLRESGDERGWRRVCAAMEQRTWAGRHWIFRPASWLLRGTIGYGYFSMRALWWLLFLVILGSAVYQRGYEGGNIVPTSKDAYDSFAACKMLPGNYEGFHALPYSLENSFPLVKFGVQDKWSPRSDEQGTACHSAGLTSRFLSHIAAPPFLWWFRWLQICAGWILATLFVGGVTGVIRKD